MNIDPKELEKLSALVEQSSHPRAVKDSMLRHLGVEPRPFGGSLSHAGAPSQPSPHAGHAEVTGDLIGWLGQRLRERSALGMKKYGHLLETWNGRDPIVDREEELIDALQYTHQWKMERDDLLAAVKENREGLSRTESVIRGAVEAIESWLISARARFGPVAVERSADGSFVEQLLVRFKTALPETAKSEGG